MSMESTKALFDHDPGMQAAVMQVAAAIPGCRDEDAILVLLIEVDEGDLYAEVARDLGFHPGQS